MSTVISLCDHTGVFVQPWVDAGYDAILVDPQHVMSHVDGRVTKLAMTVEEALPELGDVIRRGNVALVAGWPPCTDLSGSGARWWADKRAADYMFQAKAVAVIHKAPPSSERANFRSATPMGFARAVFQANLDEVMEAVA